MPPEARWMRRVEEGSWHWFSVLFASTQLPLRPNEKHCLHMFLPASMNRWGFLCDRVALVGFSEVHAYSSHSSAETLRENKNIMKSYPNQNLLTLLFGDAALHQSWFDRQGLWVGNAKIRAAGAVQTKKCRKRAKMWAVLGHSAALDRGTGDWKGHPDNK